MPSISAATAGDARLNLRYGVAALLAFALGGLALEFLHFIKLPWYLEHHLRRELIVLGHAHGALLAVVNLCYAALATAHAPRWIGPALALGALLMPLGFLLGGVFAHESDPGLAIALTPAGALAFIAALAGWLRCAFTESAATAATGNAAIVGKKKAPR